MKTTVPTCIDKLMITRNMDTTSLATTFPFTSSELTANEGVLYGINEHNDSLIIFDRFSLENANSVIFAKSGAGKSYLVKLEVLRSLMFGTEIIVIDPEAEYKALAEAVGGEYITFGFQSQSKINPFDLSAVYQEGENELGLKILSLHSLFKVIMGQLSSAEEAVLDRALVLTYKMKGITNNPATQKNEPPLMEDLYKTLIGMEETQAKGLAERIEKFVRGSFVGIFDQHSNVDIKNPFTVFSTKELEDSLRPIAMFIILDYIWTKIKKEMKQRILVVDEAWYLMKYPDSANFLYSIAKRARKYYLGLTTITQDVEDFLTGDYGKAILTNSSIQVLMKQSPAAIDKVAQVFYLSEGEKQLLLSSNIGEGIFFAGPNHVAIRVVASPEEHQLITTNPEELMEIQKRKEEMIQRAKETVPSNEPKPAI
ncbi:ATP-binding protein [Patescibacteria group bacterium]|nr:ATP-binding protein [Patescibacteria group bacterium]